MKKRSSSVLREKIVELRRTYLAKLPKALADARRGSSLLADAPADDRIVDDLFRGFHNIKGTSASLGLPEISAEGTAGTELIGRFRRLDPAGRAAALPRILFHLDASITRLEALEAAISAEEQAHSTPQAQPVAEPSERMGKDPMRRVVFYCDDDLDGAELGSQLSCFGYTFTSFTDPVDLEAAVLADPPDAVVISTGATDIMANLRHRVAVPALFVSEQSDFDLRLKAVQAGGEAFFLKPAAAHDIVDVLDRVTVRREPDPFRILIVDDEPEMACYHALILEMEGMIVHQLGHPAKILEELKEFQPDLMLIDMYMPSCSGRELSRLIRQIPQFVSLPIIFLSSETDKTEQASAMRVGADGFLTKPIAPEDLVTAVAVRAERTRVLRTLMMRDSLTGLLNHTTLFEFLDTSLANARRNGGRLCFVMLDLDHFKKVNDIYGHPAGDQVLVALARMLKQRLRNSDMIGRYGGEEFAIVLNDVSVAEAVNIVEKILKDFAALVFQVGDAEFSCSFSGGIAGFPDVGTADQLVRSADQALYSAKHRGRERVRVAEPGDPVRERP